VRELNSEGLMRGWAAGEKGVRTRWREWETNEVRMTGSGMTGELIKRVSRMNLTRKVGNSWHMCCTALWIVILGAIQINLTGREQVKGEKKDETNVKHFVRMATGDDTGVCSDWLLVCNKDENRSSSLPPSAWWIMEVWIVVHADYQLFIHSVIFIECVFNSNVSLWSHDIYCTCPSWRGILLCCSPEGFFTFFPVKGLFGSFSWSDVRFWDRDVVCLQIVKPSEANLWEWAIQNKLNWIIRPVFVSSASSNWRRSYFPEWSGNGYVCACESVHIWIKAALLEAVGGCFERGLLCKAVFFSCLMCITAGVSLHWNLSAQSMAEYMHLVTDISGGSLFFECLTKHNCVCVCLFRWKLNLIGLVHHKKKQYKMICEMYFGRVCGWVSAGVSDVTHSAFHVTA